MTRNAKQTASTVVAIEIRHSTLVMARIEPAGADAARRVHTRSVRWREKANSLYGEQGVRELTAALRTLVVEEKLAGTPVALTLNGDYCVIRVVTGSTERVRRELALLEERSELYLSLGTGRKSLATSIYELDARHQHALLAVTNGKTLQAIVQIAADVGLAVTLVEPSLVALCRLLGHTGRDAEEPVLIIAFGKNGVELGISHQGQLLLDYRPGGRTAHGDVADIVLRHLARLRRYCDRYYRYAQGKLSRVYLCGAADLVESALARFQQQDELTAEVLDPAGIDPKWKFTEASPDSILCAALGTCVPSISSRETSGGPNLIEQVHAEASRPTVAQFCRAFWPVVAAMLVAFGLFAVDRYEQSRCTRLTAALEACEPDVAELWRLRREMIQADVKIAHLESLARADRGPSWETLLSTVAQCMPKDLWMDKITAGSDGQVTLNGSSYAEATIYEFVGYLESAPAWSQVALEGTWPAAGRMGRTTKFDIECKFSGYSDGSEELTSND